MTDLELEAQYFKDSLFALGKDVAVRIEGKKHDELFWSTVFQIALPHLKPEFYPQCFQFPSFGTTGKSCVLLLKEFADKELVLCIDSDSDYLLEKPILETSFVFHTYVDSIENYWCYAVGFSDMLKKITNTDGVIYDFNNFFEIYSKTIYPYLLCSLFSTKLKDNLLPRHLLGDNAGYNSTVGFRIFEQNFKQQFSHLIRKYKADASFKAFTKRLTELGLTKKNAYLFVRGHDILDRVALPLINHIANSQYDILATSEKKAKYKKHRQANPIKVIAENNPKMADCPFYKRIVQDIQVAFQN